MKHAKIFFLAFFFNSLLFSGARSQDYGHIKRIGIWGSIGCAVPSDAVPKRVYGLGLALSGGLSFPIFEGAMALEPDFGHTGFMKALEDNLGEATHLYGPGLGLRLRLFEGVFSDQDQFQLLVRGAKLWAKNTLSKEYYDLQGNVADSESKNLMKGDGTSWSAGIAYAVNPRVSLSARYAYRPVTFTLDDESIESARYRGIVVDKKQRFDFSAVELKASYRFTSF